MYSRDYVYVRRYDVDLKNNLMILVSRSDLKRCLLICLFWGVFI